MEDNNLRKKISNINAYRIIMLVLITIVVTFIATSASMYKLFKNDIAFSGNNNITNSESIASSEASLLQTLNEFKIFLKQKYIGEINEEDMIEGAIKGYVDGLGDIYTEYLTKEEMKELAEETSGEYVGIGVYVGNNAEDNTILVVGVMNGSPALEAGMQAGDTITKIDGVSYLGEELSKATSYLKGEENTKVKVTVLRNGEELELEITRRKIVVEHVAAKMLDNKIGYIQIDAFDDGVAKTFEKELKSLQEDGMKGLIIDLRSNGGGVVSEATDIADLFSNEGETLLITKSKSENEVLEKAKRSKSVKDIPVVVLVNQGTASASEILAGALRDNYGAMLVGKKTYGKGVIQTVYSLSDGSGLKITTDEYFTPKHNKINKEGLTPDVEVELTKDSEGKYQTEEDKDAQLIKAIEKIKENL